MMIRRTTLAALLLLTGLARAEDKIPPGYEMQVLEPTGGKILRPIGWFYDEGHRGQSWMWTISKEDTHGGKGEYQTGVRIQTFVGVLEGTGKTAEAFVRDFAARKKSTADKVHKTVGTSDQGLFSRICLEVTEGDYHILYSLFWGNDMDVAVVSTAGAKLADWEANRAFFDTMSSFELIDMSRFQDQKADAEKEKSAPATGDPGPQKDKAPAAE
ncbi:MAG: hypothetical protein EOP87_26530 [Verrucomicrobiaceae bacterium]|nr:MAG: hypothetical protein EOP87_26530 [Verrucomicrobiaceae bacterium]